MITVPLLCEAGYGNLGDDLGVALIREKVAELFEYDVDLRPVSMSQARMGHMPPYNGLALIGPGTLLAPNDGDWNRWLADQVDRGWTFACVGTGVADPKDFGESSTGGYLLGRILHRSPLLWMRDLDSLNQIQKAIRYYHDQTKHEVHPNQLKHIGDPIPLYYRPKCSVQKENVVLINFGYTAYCRGNWDLLRQQLVAVCQRLREAGYTPRPWPVWPLHDDWPLERLAIDAGLEAPAPWTTVRQLEAIVCKAAAVVAFRLHAGLFALTCGTPAVMLAYQGKVNYVAQDLDWPYRVVLPNPDFFVDQTVKHVTKAIEDTQRLKAVQAQAHKVSNQVSVALRNTLQELF